MDPKTASQINDPQTGKVEIKQFQSQVTPIGPSGLPPGLVFKKVPRRQQTINDRFGATPESRKGWWAFRGKSGSVAAVQAEVDRSSMPAEEKVCLKAAIERAAGAEFNFVTVDMECFVVDNVETIHRSIKAEKKLL